MSSTIRIRLKTPKGDKTIALPTNTTLSTLQNDIQSYTQIPIQQQQIMTGYPPKAIDSSRVKDTDADPLISTLGIKSGETLIVRQVEVEVEVDATRNDTNISDKTPPPATQSQPHGQRRQGQGQGEVASSPITISDDDNDNDDDDGIAPLKRFIIPDDNSCLFNAISYGVEGKMSASHAQKLREIVARTVVESADVYSAYLEDGKTVDMYAKYIVHKNVWGGAIELPILAEHYKQ
jgi:ubiquitin thioesterase OTU1